MDILQPNEWVAPSLREENGDVWKVYYKRGGADVLAAFRLALSQIDFERRRLIREHYGLSNKEINALYADIGQKIEWVKEEREEEVDGETKTITYLTDAPVDEPENLKRYERYMEALNIVSLINVRLGVRELEPYLGVALECVTGIDGLKAGGKYLRWDDKALEEIGLDKRRVLMLLGSSADECDANLQDLVAHCLRGLGDRLGKSGSTSSES